MSFEPKIVAFCCEQSGYDAADMAGAMRLSYPENIQIIKVPCSGKVDVIHILKAFEGDADGVIIFACHTDNCHYLTGNVRAEKRVEYARKLLAEIGIEGERLEIFNLAGIEGIKFAEKIKEIVGKITELGPNIAR